MPGATLLLRTLAGASAAGICGRNVGADAGVSRSRGASRCGHELRAPRASYSTQIDPS
jgi:hypothetical protein